MATEPSTTEPSTTAPAITASPTAGHQTPEPGTSPSRRTGFSRRHFVGRGTAGITVVGLLANVPGLSSLFSETSSELPAATNDTPGVATDAQSIVAHVRDVRNGLIDLHIGGATMNVHNPQLAQAIARSAR